MLASSQHLYSHIFVCICFGVFKKAILSLVFVSLVAVGSILWNRIKLGWIVSYSMSFYSSSRLWASSNFASAHSQPTLGILRFIWYSEYKLIICDSILHFIDTMCSPLHWSYGRFWHWSIRLPHAIENPSIWGIFKGFEKTMKKEQKLKIDLSKIIRIMKWFLTAIIIIVNLGS